MPAAGSLPGDMECEVAAGISTAYELSKRGKSVMVIDRGRTAGGMTSRTSAHLAPLCDDLVSEMTKIKGQEATKLFCNSQAAAVDRIEEIQSSENIDCDFRRLDGYLFEARDMPAKTIDQEMDALRDIGAPVDLLVGVPFNGCADRNVLCYPRQATFHPLKFLESVANACHARGVEFFPNNPVEEAKITVSYQSGRRAEPSVPACGCRHQLFYLGPFCNPYEDSPLCHGVRAAARRRARRALLGYGRPIPLCAAAARTGPDRLRACRRRRPQERTGGQCG
jgi:hypothetical protein